MPTLNAEDRPGASATPAQQVVAVLSFLDTLDREGLLDDAESLQRHLLHLRGKPVELARTLSAMVHVGTPEIERAPIASFSSVVRSAVGPGGVALRMSAAAAEALVDSEPLALVLRVLLSTSADVAQPGGMLQAEVEGDPPRVVMWIDPGDQHPVSAAGLAAVSRILRDAGGTLASSSAPLRLEMPIRTLAQLQEVRVLREAVSRAEAQTLRVIQDFGSLRRAVKLAEAQQLRAVKDFRSAHREALNLATRLDDAYLETITALAKAAEARDPYTGGHVERVRRYSLMIGDAMGLESGVRRHLEFGAVLHDIGKIGVPDAILAKPGPLERSEWAWMRRHPTIGLRVLEGVVFLAPALDAVAYHHERWDGQGYPDGLRGEEIPLLGRIVGVADAFDAMTTTRPYRTALPILAALAEIQRGRGAQFDPDAAAAFLKLESALVPAAS